LSEEAGTQSPSLWPWPGRFLGPRPGLKEINLLCWALFCLCIVAPTCFFIIVQIKTGKYFFRQSSVDFVYFYGVGQMANSNSAADLYNYRAQLATFNSILPLQHGTYGPSPYPPFVAQFFRLFALMPFARAYFLWVALLLVLYVTGVVLLLREFFPEERLQRSIILCFALSYYPFLRNTLASGQLSALALFVLTLALMQERRGRHLLSGILLAILLYKFTLLLLIVPMLAITRRFKALGGFAAGATVLAGISTLLAGVEIWPAYARFLRSFGQTSGVGGSSSLQLQKYVDLNTFSYAVPGGRSRAALLLLACFVVGVVGWLVVVWWRSDGSLRPQKSLQWATAIAWTMLVNVYYPIYDSVLLVVMIVLLLAAARELGQRRAFEWIVLAAVTTFAVSWFSESVADRYGVQLLTFAILALAVAATNLLNRAGKAAVSGPAPLAG
jgi:hypothetical protein